MEAFSRVVFVIKFRDGFIVCFLVIFFESIWL